MNITKHIPNLITLINLLAGCLAILFVAEGQILLASWMVFLAAVLDFLDGFAARMLKAYSAIGIQLDSLADMISFGVAPGFIMYDLITNSQSASPIEHGSSFYLPYLAFLIPLFAALRLAKFNIDDRQTDSFLGLPTPAVAIMIASLSLVREQLQDDVSFYLMIISYSSFYITLTLLLSILMVSELPLFSLKFKTIKLNGNEVRYLFLCISLLLFILFFYAAIPLIILFYIILSVTLLLFKPKGSK